MRLSTIAFFATLVLAPLAAAAQGYPNHTIRLIVPFAAGGGADAIVRPLADRLSAELGQSIVIDNRGGANGNIGAELVAHAPADGYTLLFANASLPISASLYKKLPFDVLKDFTPVAEVSVSASVLVVNPKIPAHSVAELIALAKARPGGLNYATAGAGSTMHLAAELFDSMAGVQMTHLPFKGAGPAISDVDRRPRRPALRQHSAGVGRHQGRPAAAARGDHAEALVGAARRADARRGRPEGLRLDDLVRPARARQPAAGDRRPAQPRGR